MRITIFVKPIEEFYYDVGLRHRDGNDNLKNTMYRWGKPAPRFLEDFIEMYGAENIDIVEEGSMSCHHNYIYDLFES